MLFRSIAIQAYLKKQEKSQINNLTLHLKKLEKEEQTKPKVSRRKEIIKMRAEINKIETKKVRQGSTGTECINSSRKGRNQQIMLRQAHPRSSHWQQEIDLNSICQVPTRVKQRHVP